MTLDEAVQGLGDLDRNDLRQLALEALLTSDGPDEIFPKDPSLVGSQVRLALMHLEQGKELAGVIGG